MLARSSAMTSRPVPLDSPIPPLSVLLRYLGLKRPAAALSVAARPAFS